MNNLLILSKYQSRLIFRNIKAIILGFGVPLIMFFVMAQSFQSSGAVSYTKYMIPAFVIVIIINSVLFVFGQQYITYKEQNNLLKYKLLGISSLTVSLSTYLAILVYQLVVAAVFVVIASSNQNLTIPMNNIFSIILVVLLTNFFQFAITYFLTSFITKATVYQPIAMLVFYFELFLGNLTIPLAIMPKEFVNILKIINPVIYANDMMSGIWFKNTTIINYPKEFFIIILASFILIALGSLISKKMKK